MGLDSWCFSFVMMNADCALVDRWALRFANVCVKFTAMEIPKSCKIEKSVSRDGRYPMLLNPYLHIEGDQGLLMASDASNGVVVPVTVGPDDVSGPVSLDALKAARKDGELSCLAEYCIVPGSAAFPRPQVTGYPRLQDLVGKGGDPDVVITLNVKTLLAIAASMGTDVVTLKAGPDLVEVEPYAGAQHIEGARGFIMPVRQSAL